MKKILVLGGVGAMAGETTVDLVRTSDFAEIMVADIDIAKEIAFHRAHGKWATVVAVQPPGRFGALQMAGERVAGFSEKPRGDGGLINGGFFVLSPRCLDLIKGDDANWEGEPLVRLAEMGQLMAFPHQGFWQPMDTLREKNLLESLWDSGEAPWKVWK